MNIKTTIIAVLALGWASCQKDKEQPEVKPDEKKYEVTFGVSGLDLEVKDLTSTNKSGGNTVSAAILQDQINQLTFVIYDSNGDEYLRKTQLPNSGGDTFGSFTESLPLDRYTIVTIGSKSSFGINAFYKPLTSLPVRWPLKTARMMYEQPTDTHDHIYKTDDTFLGKLEFTLTPPSQAIDLKLKRIVGKLDFNIQDVSSYSVSLLDEATDYVFATQTSSGGIESEMSGPINNNSKPLSLFILRTDRLLNIEITGGGRTQALQVPVYKNKRTVVSGKLLSERIPVPLKVTVNDQWLADTVVVKF